MGLFDIFRRRSKVPKPTGVPLDESVTSFTSQGIYSEFSDYVDRNYKKEMETYRIMEKDALVSGVLQLYASGATQVDPSHNHTVWINTDNASLKAELEDFLYNIVDIDERIYSFAYTLARDGQLHLRTFDSQKLTDWYFEAVDNLKEVIYPLFERGKIVGYYYEDENNEGKKYPSSEFISMMLRLDESTQAITLTEGPRGKEVNKDYKTAHGVSILSGAVVAWRVLTLIENVLVSARVGKTSVYNLVKLEIGNSSQKEANRLIDDAKKIFKTKEAINLVEGAYKTRNEPIAANENIVIPMRNGVGNMTVEPVGGTYELRSVLDLDYFRNKFFAAVRTPKAFLGFDGETSSVLGDNSLGRLDANHARSVQRVQTQVRTGIKALCDFYLICTGRSKDSLPTYEVGMSSISSSEEKTRLEEQGEKLRNADSIVSLALNNFSNEISKPKLFEYVFGTLLGLPLSEFSNRTSTGLPIKNFGIRGSGYGDTKKDGLKYFTIHPDAVSRAQMESIDYELYTIVNDKEVPFLDAFYRKRRPLHLTEATYKDLKDRVKSTDPDRVTKAKKLTTSYIGLNKNGDLMFKTSSGTTRGKFWYQTVRLLDLPKALEVFADDGDITDRDIVSYSIQGNLAVYCNDPSFKYWGWQWMATQDEYGIVPEDRAPVYRNTELRGAVCKHIYIVLQVLPFWTNRIVKDLRAQFFRDVGVGKGKKVDYKPGLDKEWQNN